MSAGGYDAEPSGGGPNPKAVLAAPCCWRTVSRKFDFSVPSIDSSSSLCRPHRLTVKPRSEECRQ